METDDDALEQFLGRVPGGGEDFFVIGRETTDEGVRGLDGADRARVHIFERNSGGDVNLATAIDCFFGAGKFGEKLKAIGGEDERFLNVIGLLETGKAIDPGAGLEPLDIDEAAAFIARSDLKIHFVNFGRENVVDDDGRFHPCAEDNFMRTGFDHLGLVRDGGEVPFLMSGAAAAECFQVPGVDIIAGDLCSGDAKYVIGPTDMERVLGEN